MEIAVRIKVILFPTRSDKFRVIEYWTYNLIHYDNSQRIFHSVQ
jgi:hypothetical protein